MSNEAVESTPSTPTSEISIPPVDLEMSAPVEISTPLVGFEMSSSDEISTPTSGVRMRGGGVRMRGVGVRMRGGSEDVSSEAGSSSSNRRLRTITRKIVRMRGKGDGSRAYMYLGGRKPIRFGVSWDPVDEEAMLGNAMGIPTPSCLIGIIPEDGSMLKDQNLFCYKNQCGNHL
ncbi:hypothetical protein Tco_1394567 [Tanacetum coccineum]